jgi:hypothetical protein
MSIYIKLYTYLFLLNHENYILILIFSNIQSNMSKVVKCTILLTTMDSFAEVNAIYSEFFPTGMLIYMNVYMYIYMYIYIQICTYIYNTCTCIYMNLYIRILWHEMYSSNVFKVHLAPSYSNTEPPARATFAVVGYIYMYIYMYVYIYILNCTFIIKHRASSKGYICSCRTTRRGLSRNRLHSNCINHV